MHRFPLFGQRGACAAGTAQMETAGDQQAGHAED
jgi:hypothetical protein